MNDDMKATVEAGDRKRLYTPTDNDPHVLENINKTSFVNSPLHIAASAGQIRFATEIIRLTPSFARKLNTRDLQDFKLWTTICVAIAILQLQ